MGGPAEQAKGRKKILPPPGPGLTDTMQALLTTSGVVPGLPPFALTSGFLIGWAACEQSREKHSVFRTAGSACDVC